MFATTDNAANLAPAFIAEMTRRYAGNSPGPPGTCRRIDRGLSPQASGGVIGSKSNASPNRAASEIGGRGRRPTGDRDRVVRCLCGIVVAAKGEDHKYYVLDDRSIQGREPTLWARAAIAAKKDFDADRIVAEVNQGGDLVVGVLRQVDATATVRKVRASRGKWVRAEPVAALYAEGRVSPRRCLRSTRGRNDGVWNRWQGARQKPRSPRCAGLGAHRPNESGTAAPGYPFALDLQSFKD